MDLPSCQLFEGFTELQNERLWALAEEIAVEKNEWLFREGDPGDRFYCIQGGAVELLTRMNGHMELPITILRKAGSHFGTSSLVVPHVYSLSARSFEKSVVWSFHRDRLMDQIRQDPELGFILMSNLAGTFLERLKETRQEVKIHFKTLFKVIRY